MHLLFARGYCFCIKKHTHTHQIIVHTVACPLFVPVMADFYFFSFFVKKKEMPGHPTSTPTAPPPCVLAGRGWHFTHLLSARHFPPFFPFCFFFFLFFPFVSFFSFFFSRMSGQPHHNQCSALPCPYFPFSGRSRQQGGGGRSDGGGEVVLHLLRLRAHGGAPREPGGEERGVRDHFIEARVFRHNREASAFCCVVFGSVRLG